MNKEVARYAATAARQIAAKRPNERFWPLLAEYMDHAAGDMHPYRVAYLDEHTPEWRNAQQDLPKHVKIIRNR